MIHKQFLFYSEKQTDIFITFCLVAMGNERCTHTAKMVTMIASIIVPFGRAFLWNP